jgi:hypothetical protein
MGIKPLSNATKMRQSAELKIQRLPQGEWLGRENLSNTMLRLRATKLWASLTGYNSQPLSARLHRGICSCSDIAFMLGRSNRRDAPLWPPQRPAPYSSLVTRTAAVVATTTRLRLFSSFEPSAEKRTERELLRETTSEVGRSDDKFQVSLAETSNEEVETNREDYPTDDHDNDDDESLPYEELTLIDAPTEEERLAAEASAEAQQRQATVTVKILFCLSKWEVFPGAIIQDSEGPSHVSLSDMTDIQRQAQEFYQDWDTPHDSIHLDYYNGTEWIYLYDISLLEPYKMNKRPVPVRNQRFFDDPNIMTTPYRHCV